MEYSINNKNSTNILICELQHGDKMKVAINSVIAMEPNLGLTFSEDGNPLKSITKMVTGSNMLFQYLIASKGDGRVWLSSDKPGSIFPIELDGTYDLKVSRDAFIAATESVIVESKLTSLSSSKNGLQILTLKGKGEVFLGNYGGFIIEQLQRGQELLVNSGCVMAWTSSVRAKCEKSGNGISNPLTGTKAEVLKFSGPGHVILQTRSNNQMRFWLRDLGMCNNEDTQNLIKKSIEDNNKSFKSEVTAIIKEQLKGLNISKQKDEVSKGQKEYEALNKDAKISLASKVSSMKNLNNAEQLRVIQELTSQSYSADVISYVQEHVAK